MPPQNSAPEFIPDAAPAFIPDSAPAATQNLPPDSGADALKAGVHSKMLDVSPGYAYQNGDEIGRQLQSASPGYDANEIDPTILNDVKVGLQGSIFGLMDRDKLPDVEHDLGKVDEFITGLSSMVSDLPFYIAGGLAGGAAGSEVPGVGTALGAGAGSFALPAAIRKTLMDRIKDGDVDSVGGLLRRAADVTWAATKGALTGAATEAAGGLPVGGLIAKSPIGSIAVKGLYQAATLTTAADLLDGKVPNADDFVKNAALIVPLNLVTHGIPFTSGDAKQAAMDVYARDGTTPAETAQKLDAQPTVKADLPPGLRAAIKVGSDVLEGDEGETHAELAGRLGSKPVEMEELQANPELASEVLANPEIHDQDVIDAAWVTWDDQLRAAHEPRLPPESNVGIEEQRLQDSRGNLKSGRGFVAPDSGKFLTREQAAAWVKKNEPDTHEIWEQDAGKGAELRSEDYREARQRVSGRNLAEGEPAYNGLSPRLTSFLATARKELNSIKAATGKASAYGKSVIRTLFAGPRNMLRAEGEQVASGLRKLVPDSVDQEALSFMRDYRDDPEQLRSEIESVRSGSNETLKALIPSMERALDPSPEMMQADQRLTQYFSQALDTGRQLDILDSSIDPSRYSPRLLMRVMEDAENAKGVGRPKFTQKTPNAIRREYLHKLDSLKSGDFEARTFNAMDELSVYADRFSTAAATKMFVTELKNTELGKWGSAAKVPEGWVELAPGQRGFHQTMTVKNEAGETNTFSNGLYVPKQIADAMKPILGSGGLPEQILNALHLQNYVKGIELSLSIFHMKALTVTAMNNMSFGDFTRSLKSDNDSAAFMAQEQEGALWGLETTKTGVPYEAYQGLKPSSLNQGFLSNLRNLPVLKQVDAFARSLTEETFDVIQRKFKVMDFSQKQAAWLAKHPDAGASEYGSAMRGISKEVNSAYGGLNWEVMGVSKPMRDISRLFILAPDWTFSNVANVKYAGEGGPAGTAARAFWVKSFATGIALSQATSIMLTGQMSKNPTSVYLGQDKTGKDMFSDVFFAGAPKDAITLVNRVGRDGLLEGLVGFAANKFGPMAATGKGLMMNKQQTGAPISKPTDTLLEKNVKQVEYAAGELAPVPFGIKDIAQLLTDPKEDTSKWDYVLPLLGAYVTRDKEQTGRDQSNKSTLPGMNKGRARRNAFSIVGRQR